RTLWATVVRRLGSEYLDDHGESDAGADACGGRHDRDASSGAGVRQPGLRRVGRQARSGTECVATVLADVVLATLVGDVWLVDGTRPHCDGLAAVAVDHLRGRPDRADPSCGDGLDWWPCGRLVHRDSRRRACRSADGTYHHGGNVLQLAAHGLAG